jgi:uncharacterized protein YndB with AHSA1/START domain
MYSTEVRRRVDASAAEVFGVLLDPDAVAQWRVPTNMSALVHEFDAREGGRFRVSLTYRDGGAGKSGERTDTYQGTFTRIVPGREVVERLEFETDDPALHGTMTMTTTLHEEPGGTTVVMRHDGIPDAVPPEDNDTGMRMALDNLARLVERR